MQRFVKLARRSIAASTNFQRSTCKTLENTDCRSDTVRNRGNVRLKLTRFGGAVQAHQRRLRDAQDTPTLLA